MYFAINLYLALMGRFKHIIIKVATLVLVSCTLFSCEDQGCLRADDFGGVYFVINSNPEAVYGNYPNQSTEWLDTGLRASGGGFSIAISGGFSPWGMQAANLAALGSLPSCFDRGADDFNPAEYNSNNFGLCSKRVPVDSTTFPPSLLSGDARVLDLSQQNCICYKGETPVPMPNANQDGVTACSDPTDPSDCSCDDSGPDNAAEGGCVFTYDLATNEKLFDLTSGKPKVRDSDHQGSVCKYEKGMGLYMGLFGASGNVQPLRLYHLFAQEERCPISLNEYGNCAQESAVLDENGDPTWIDRTRYIYTSADSRIPIYDDKSGNNCSDNNANDDEYHRMREVIKLKIADSYYRDNYGQYTVEFLTGVYSDHEVLIMEYVVNVLENTLLGEISPESGEREGGLLEFIYKSIIGDSRFVLVIQMMLVMYIMFFGVSVLMGLTEISRKEIFTRIFQISVVLTFTTVNGWQAYNQYVVGFFKLGMDEVTNKIVGFSSQYMEQYGGDSISSVNNSRIISNNPDSMGAKFAYVDSIIRMLFSDIVTKKIWSLFFYQWLGFVYIIVIYLLIFFFLWTMSVVVFVYCVTLTKMVIALALGPIFISFILFKQTNEYFKKWIGFLAARALEVVILFLIVFAFVSLIDRKFNELLYFRACIIEWDLWLFKLKFLVAEGAHEMADGVNTHDERELDDWMEMLMKIGLLMYMTKEVIGQVPALAGKLISVGGAANQTGAGGSYAQSGFNMATKAVGEVFGGGGMKGLSMAGDGVGKVGRGMRKVFTGTRVSKLAGKVASVSPIRPRGAMRNAIIDKDISKAMKEAGQKGKTGAAKDQFVRAKLLDGKYTKDHGGGLRGWANENKNSAAALNITSGTIAKRLDEKLFQQPLKEAMESRAKELQNVGAGKVMLGKELRSQLEKDAKTWAKENSSLGEGAADKLIDKVGGGKSYTKSGEFFDRISELNYDKASKGKRFGNEDEREEYMRHLNSKKFDKAFKSSQARDLEKDGWKKRNYYSAAKSKLGRFGNSVKGVGGVFSNESKAFVRRSNNRQASLFGSDRERFGFSSGKLSRDLEDLDFSATRGQLMDGDLSKDISKIKDRFDGDDSLSRRRAKAAGVSSELMLDKKRDKEIQNAREKQKLYAESLKGKYADRVNKLTPGEKETLKNDLKNSEQHIGEKHREGLLNNPNIKSKESRAGFTNVELERGKSIRIGDKELKSLSIAELAILRDTLGVKGSGLPSDRDSRAAAAAQKAARDSGLKEGAALVAGKTSLAASKAGLKADLAAAVAAAASKAAEKKSEEVKAKATADAEKAERLAAEGERGDLSRPLTPRQGSTSEDSASSSSKDTAVKEADAMADAIGLLGSEATLAATEAALAAIRSGSELQEAVRAALESAAAEQSQSEATLVAAAAALAAIDAGLGLQAAQEAAQAAAAVVNGLESSSAGPAQPQDVDTNLSEVERNATKINKVSKKGGKDAEELAQAFDGKKGAEDELREMLGSEDAGKLMKSLRENSDGVPPYSQEITEAIKDYKEKVAEYVDVVRDVTGNLGEDSNLSEIGKGTSEIKDLAEVSEEDGKKLDAAIKKEKSTEEKIRVLVGDDNVGNVMEAIKEGRILPDDLTSTPELIEAIKDYQEAAAEYGEVIKEITEGAIIAKDLEVEFGASITDALCLGSGSALLKGGDALIGGGAYDDTKGPQEQVMLDIINGEVAQYALKAKVGKNAIRYKEYDLSKLEKDHNLDTNDLRSDINKLKSEIDSLKSDLGKDTMKMESAQGQADSLKGDRFV